MQEASQPAPQNRALLWCFGAPIWPHISPHTQLQSWGCLLHALTNQHKQQLEKHKLAQSLQKRRPQVMQPAEQHGSKSKAALLTSHKIG
jgi:hypothetical protein